MLLGSTFILRIVKVCFFCVSSDKLFNRFRMVESRMKLKYIFFCTATTCGKLMQLQNSSTISCEHECLASWVCVCVFTLVHWRCTRISCTRAYVKFILIKWLRSVPDSSIINQPFGWQIYRAHDELTRRKTKTPRRRGRGNERGKVIN